MKLFRAIFAIAVGLAFATLATAQSYPNKPVKIIVAYQAGQGTDVATRYIAERLNKALGQNFYIENKARRRRQHRHRGRGAFGAGRLHADDGHQRHAWHQPVPL